MGVGIVLVTIAGVFLYKQMPNIPAIIGMGLIILGLCIFFPKPVG
ncbi:hypothetical protein BHECKSOX2_1468 [Bathymodiolus heckerae thiotrophic gill symbiont]|nr:hypothetical protein [Bathymodiolus heckerae thiotrophic gill symbiont]SMN12931.1 hypothetical protein BHECKSOX2_1468 [Bathymodiolus heckerae thiotrophic gill symbiont]SMN14439.1 hypothetical protein CRYPD_1175 [uncultured Candidatus Thioglobus sp.]